MESRKIIEANVVFSFYKDTDLFLDYINKIDSMKFFELEESQFFYNVGSNLIKQGYKVIDPVSIEAWLVDKPASKKLYEEYGGFNTIKEIQDIVILDNFEKYYDDLLKLNVAKELKAKGFNVDTININDMSSQDLYEYYDYLLNDLFVEGVTDTKIHDLDISDDYIENRNQGNGIGASIALKAPRLNYDIGGLNTRSVVIVGGRSGSGKSSFIMSCMVMPLAQSGIKTAILSNEQDIDEFRDLLLVETLFTEFKYYHINRKKLQAGDFSKEDMTYIKKAQEHINKTYSKNIRFVKMFNYNTEDTKKVIKKLAREKITHILYDTMKAEDSSSTQYTGELVETSKALFNMADKLNLCIVWTQQCSLHSIGTRHLGMYNLSGSRQVSEVASQVLILRQTWEDEDEGEQYDITPYNLKKDSEGHYLKDENKHAIKELVNRDKENGKYMLVFNAKNRRGEDGKVYLFRQIASYNVWNELGFANVSHVDRR